MTAVKEIVIVLILVVLALVHCAPTPGGHAKNEKYIIHVPIKYHTIHHLKIQKVPIYVKKHVHHHKYEDHEPQVHEEEGYDRYDDVEGNASYGYDLNYEEYDH